MTGEAAKAIGTNYLFEVQEDQQHASMPVPALELNGDASTYADIVFNYFQKVWDDNGYLPIRSPHHDTIVLPAKKQQLPCIVVNSYRGQTDGQTYDRQPYLESYRRERSILDSMASPEARKLQQEKLERILRHIPDIGGLQGVQTYRLYIPASHQSKHYRLSGLRSLSISESYHLGPEANTYNLPTRSNKGPMYPYLRGRKPTLFIDGERFSANGVQNESNESYFARWRSMLQLIEPIMRQEVSF